MDTIWNQLPGVSPDPELEFLTVVLGQPAFYINLTDTIVFDSAGNVTIDWLRVEVSSASFTECSGVSSGVLNDPHKVCAAWFHLPHVASCLRHRTH